MKIFLIIYISWFLSEILIAGFFRSQKSDLKGKDRGSIRIMWVFIIISNFSAVYCSNLQTFSISSNPALRYAGLFLIIAGIILRVWVIVSLGRFFTVDVTIKENHQIKTDGFYTYVRHPSYTASLISFAGFGISLNNWLSLIIVLTVLPIAFIIRIRIEEKALIEYFKSDYLLYKKKTKALIPYLL